MLDADAPKARRVFIPGARVWMCLGVCVARFVRDVHWGSSYFFSRVVPYPLPYCEKPNGRVGVIYYVKDFQSLALSKKRGCGN